MHEVLYSPYLIPAIAILGGLVYLGITAWKQVQEQKLAVEREIRLKELELRAQQGERSEGR